MHLKMLQRPLYLMLIAAMAATGSGVGHSDATAAPSEQKIDLLDPDFIKEHGGHAVAVSADAGKSPFEVFGEAFGTDNPVEGATSMAGSRWR
ncbi:hypothetical protein M6D81_01845 [Paenibacillus sp. J5C_2022]|uniref:hypothetical protein n=1 Tax=Paenibacillus sp. J5C2022 TaxID=2977129 RepID=UPI0021D2F7CF|nr:hypothetical protein [Paenibacillus sp. J5C2022]MCU6707439.1 hypothetical protein [Paenibacillus sp. J5C2022]